MRHGRIIPEKRSDVSIRGIYESQMEAIIDIRFGYDDAETYNKEVIDTFFLSGKKLRRTITVSTAMINRNKISDILSVDGVVGKDSQVVIAALSRLIAANMKEPISHIKGWVNSWIAISVVRLNSRMFHVYQVPSPLHNREPDWESGL